MISLMKKYNTKSIQEPVVTKIFKAMKERQQNCLRYKTLKRLNTMNNWNFLQRTNYYRDNW